MGEAARVLAPETPAPWATVASMVERFGFASSRSFLRWCYRNKVEVRGEGKTSFVSPAEVERTRIAAREILAMKWAGPTPADEGAGCG